MIPCGTAVRILIPKDGAMIRGTQSNPRRSTSLGHPVMCVVWSRRGSSRSAPDAAGKTADASLPGAVPSLAPHLQILHPCVMAGAFGLEASAVR